MPGTTIERTLGLGESTIVSAAKIKISSSGTRRDRGNVLKKGAYGSMPMIEVAGSRGEVAEAKTTVFISYSRKDMAFADRLDRELGRRGFEVLVDRSDIFAFEDWWQRIQALIAQADSVVFVLSPDAVASEVARREVAFAASLNKRFAPIVCRITDADDIPAELNRLNFIFFDDDERFDESMGRLSEALETDIDWIRKHTEYGQAARRWEVAGRPGPRRSDVASAPARRGGGMDRLAAAHGS